jgi:iron complex transport system ATP-binding protein
MTTQSEYILEAENLTCRIGNKAILEQVTLRVRKQEKLAVIGPNGAGKTTLLRCLNGLLKPGGGQVLLGSRPLQDYSPRQIARQLSYVPQAGQSPPPFTVFEFVLLGRYAHHGPFVPPSRIDENAAAKALEITGLTGLADRKLESLSGGERQKAMIAAALAQETPVLLLDEPATFLDYRHQAEILHLLRKLTTEQEKTLILVSHELNRGPLECDQVLALRQGKVVFCGAPDALLQPGKLEDIFGIAFERFRCGEKGHLRIWPAEVNE